MRCAILAVAVVVFGIASPAMASKKEARHPGWDACYDLGWVRGVHTEQNELPDWMEQCLAGDIPFGQAMPKAVRRQSHNDQD
jgi:hypothetical protein